MYLDHISIAVKNLECSLNFYKSLGFLEIERPHFDFNGAWLQVSKEDEHQLHLIEFDQDIILPISTRGLHFAISLEEEFETFQKFLIDNKIDHRQPKTRPDGITQIFLSDPDGYLWEFNNDQRKL